MAFLTIWEYIGIMICKKGTLMCEEYLLCRRFVFALLAIRNIKSGLN